MIELVIHHDALTFHPPPVRPLRVSTNAIRPLRDAPKFRVTRLVQKSIG